MYQRELLEQADPALAAAMEGELRRQRENIELIASENFTSPEVMAAMGPDTLPHIYWSDGGHGQPSDQ